MNKNEKVYEPPKATIYRFDENERILTESGNVSVTPTPEPNYAANALNELFGGINTTIE